MPIKTMTTRTICNPNDFVDNCSSVEELQKLINKCQDKILAIKDNKLIKCVEQIIDITKEIEKIYPCEDTPFFDKHDCIYTWGEIGEALENYIEELTK